MFDYINQIPVFEISSIDPKNKTLCIVSPFSIGNPKDFIVFNRPINQIREYSLSRTQLADWSIVPVINKDDTSECRTDDNFPTIEPKEIENNNLIEPKMYQVNNKITYQTELDCSNSQFATMYTSNIDNTTTEDLLAIKVKEYSDDISKIKTSFDSADTIDANNIKFNNHFADIDKPINDKEVLLGKTIYLNYIITEMIATYNQRMPEEIFKSMDYQIKNLRRFLVNIETDAYYDYIKGLLDDIFNNVYALPVNYNTTYTEEDEEGAVGYTKMTTTTMEMDYDESDI